MRFKLAIFAIYALATLMAGKLAAQTSPAQQGCEDKLQLCEKKENSKNFALDCRGRRGFVCFDHKEHEAYMNPDADFPHKAAKGSECVSCHHKRNEATGAPLLAKCSLCHRSQGATNPENPRNRDMDEVWSERAYHDLCIGCHKASNEKGLVKVKAPVACSECHASKTDAEGRPVGMASGAN